ncbi:unnamed protein product [Camellia sinensis]
MGRGGKVGSKPCGKRRIRSKDNGSDESDEDYTVGGDEEFNDSEDYTSFTGEESEESLGEFEEEEDEVEQKVRKASRSKGRKAFMGRKKNGVGKARKKRKVSYKVEDDEDFEDEDEDEDFEVKSGVGKARKKRKVSYKVEDDEDFEDEGDDEDFKEKNGVGKARYKRKVSYKVEDDEDFEVEDDEDFEEKNGIGKARSKRKVSYKVEDDEDFKDEGDDEDFEEKNGIGKARNKRKVSYKVEDDDDFKDEGDDEDFEDEGDDEDFEDEGVDDEDDDEFAPDEIDLYDEDELPVGKKNKKVRRPFLENGHVKGRKRKRNSKVFKKPMRKKLTKSRGLRRNSVAGNDGAFTEKKPVVKERNKKNSGQRNRRIMRDSDPEFVSSGLSDFDYTISEEEREQVREASKFCRDLTTALRSSFSTKRSQDGGVLFHHQRKRSGRKGKGKVEDLKNEAVCGICFSEEGKKIVRGTLNCCSHYFCFTCIMEWSKVESRCPLCKQRFASISKPAKSNTGFDLRTVVIQVPERDQVYQPSEEELRGYLDPYENVICTECQQGGDDALMLLCDLCDSPAHTFCVGLGRVVPEGSWYCEGCRPTAFASSNPQAPNPTPDHRTMNDFSGRSSPVENVREAIDLNSAYVPETPLNHGTGIFSSPRHPVGDFQAASPVSGTGVLTVSVRRRIQRQIHDLLSNRSSRTVGMSASTSGNNLLGSQIEQGREVAFQHAITPERSSSHQPFSQGRYQGNFMPSVQSTRDLSSARLSHSRGQPIQGQSSTSGADGSANRMLQAGFAGISRGMNSRLGYEQQLHPCGSRSSIADDNMSPYRYREVSHFNVEKEQVQSMVRSHLKSLSREMELGYSTTFKDIARISTHTILASCGIEHQASEVYPVQPPSMCNHAEAMASGQMSLMKGFCTSCFDSFVRRVVREITNTQSASSIV